MTQEEQIEQRLAALEQAVAELRQLVRKQTVNHGLGRLRGAFKDDPVFEEMVRLGREFREGMIPVEEGLGP